MGTFLLTRRVICYPCKYQRDALIERTEDNMPVSERLFSGEKRGIEMFRDCFEECPCPKDPHCEFFEKCEICIPRHYGKGDLPFCERDKYLVTLTPERREELLAIYATQDYKNLPYTLGR